MNRTLGILAVLLAAQLLLAAAMSFSAPDLSAQRPDTPLVDLGQGKVDRIVLQGPDKQSLVLAQHDGNWVLPGTGGFPADGGRVQQLLERLEHLKRGLAVATTAAAQTRFKVGDADFERRVQLQQGERTLATLYFGTSPGLRQVHARNGEDTAVYTAAFGLYELPLKAGDWEDKSILHLSARDIDSIKLAGVTLSRAADSAANESATAPAGHDSGSSGTDKTAVDQVHAGWRAAGLGDGEILSQPAAATLVQKIAALDIGGVLGTDDLPAYALQAPALVLSVDIRGGKPIEYRLGKRVEQHDYVLKVSTRPEYFRLPAFIGDELVKAAGRSQLVMAEPGEGNATASAAAVAAPASAGAVASAPPTAVNPQPHAATGGKL